MAICRPAQAHISATLAPVVPLTALFYLPCDFPFTSGFIITVL
jgi:hypothetical protein